MREGPKAALAPRWHTAVLVLLLLSVATCGLLLQHGEARGRAPLALNHRGIVGQYLPLLVVSWALVLYTCRLFRPGNALPALLGQRWHTVRRACIDVLLALLTAVLILVIQLAAQHLGMGRNAAVSALLPRTGAERLVWLLVATSVGFCEEVVYRGYLQTQLAAFTGSARWGLFLQAVLFGIAHAEQGLGPALSVAGYGLIFGLLAQLRRSLLPGIASHALLDLAAGLWR